MGSKRSIKDSFTQPVLQPSINEGLSLRTLLARFSSPDQTKGGERVSRIGWMV
jgi:hypothetical protein